VFGASNFGAHEFEGKQDFIDCILMNNTASFQAEDPRGAKKRQKVYEFVYRPRGPALEVAALNMLNGVNSVMDVREMLLELRSNKQELFSFPFDQTLKRKTVVYAIDD
jgi:hypothetical protein